MKRFWVIGLIGAAILSGCTADEMGRRPEGVVFEGEDVQLPFSLSVGSGISPVTKMTDAITQVDANSDYSVFRGIEQMFIIPFSARRSVTASDERHAKNLLLPHLGISASFGADASAGNLAGLVENNNSHLYKGVYVKSGTASVLAYGKSIDEAVSAAPTDSVDFKRRNGVLRGSNLHDAATPDEIVFNLEPFIGTNNEADMQSKLAGILSYMNSVANARATSGGSTQVFSSYSNNNSITDIANFFASFSNNGSIYNNDEGLMFSGGSEGLEKLLSDLYQSCASLRSGLGTNTWGYRMCSAIINAINNGTYVSVSGTTVTFNSDYAGFPGSFGVPDGAIAIQWNGTAFVQVPPASSTLAPVEAYCYPPSLWYWTNSTLRTSDEEDVDDQYKSSNPDWASILSHYMLGNAVKPGTTSAAVVNPLQYGVAMLELEMKASASTGGTYNLLDSRASTVDIRGNVFPLTGILVGEQHNQHYNFTPSAGTNYYVYDSDVMDGTQPKAYIRFSDTGFKKIRTLLVQTEEEQDVHYALEFRNDSGAAFYGANGCIVPASGKFYLVGTMEISTMSAAQRGGIDCVFLQDHVTQLSVSVNSLAKAYNTIPELRDPQLEIGVVTRMDWVHSTPAEVPMY